MSERGQRIRLGLFVVGALAALATLVILFSKRPAILSSRDRFQVTFSNAPNLQPGTPVRRSGVKIGEVNKVELDPNGLVNVELAVDRRYPPRHNEIISISQSLLSGDASVDFLTDNTPNKPKDVNPYKPDETDPKSGGEPIKGRGPLDIRAGVEGAKDLGKVAQEALEQIRVSIDQFTRVAPEMERTLREYSLLSQTIRQAIPEIQQTNDSVRRLADTTRGNFPNVAETNDKAKVAIDNWNKAGERLNVILMANEARFGKAAESLAATLTQANKFLSDDNQRTVMDLVRNVNAVFSDDNQKAVSSILKNASAVMSDENVRNVNVTIKNVRTASENVDQLMKDGAKAMKQISDTAAKADQAIENIRKASAPFADSASDFSRNLTYTSAQVGFLAKDVRELLKGYASSDGTVQKLLTDPRLYNQVSDAVLGLNRLLPRLELILDDFKDFSDKIARHPNSLIFDKGGGLKGSPFAPTAPGIGTRPMGTVTTPPIYPQR